MLEANAARTYIDSATFRAALERLTDNDLIRLRKKAHYLALGSGVEGQDLLNEAIRRTLDEDGRNCPSDVPVTVFLANAMRSIADGEREKFDRESPSGDPHDEESAVGVVVDPAPPVDSIVQTRQVLLAVMNFIEGKFKDDAHALAVVYGICEEWTIEEVKEMEVMNDKEYDAARKRVRRAIDSQFMRGTRHGEE